MQFGTKFGGRCAAVIVGLVAAAGTAEAGGFAVREQSTVFLGSAYAGAAAGGALSSMYWNSAATAQLPGLNSESSYTLILPQSDVTVTAINGRAIPPSGSGDIGIDAVAGATYGSYQLSSDLWIGIGLNAPFGLGTKPENINYTGSVLGRTTKFFSFNANPTLAYRIAPGITVGAGVQIEYGRGKLQFATGSPTGPTTQFRGDDVAVGGTAGILFEPAAGTSIGVGYRSQLNHELEGTFYTFSPLGQFGVPATAEVNLPDIVTVSLRQEIAPNMRLLGTVEWTNWSRFENLTLKASAPVGTLSIPANWSDGWFFSGGGEYDYSSSLTLRGGVAYEISPVDDPTKRFTTIPDSDRVWLNIGASYRWSEATTIDIAFSHVFLQDETFARSPIGSPLVFSGNVESDIDLFSIGYRTRW